LTASVRSEALAAAGESLDYAHAADAADTAIYERPADDRADADS
jgi:hypothetical protein